MSPSMVQLTDPKLLQDEKEIIEEAKNSLNESEELVAEDTIAELQVTLSLWQHCWRSMSTLGGKRSIAGLYVCFGRGDALFSHPKAKLPIVFICAALKCTPKNCAK